MHFNRRQLKCKPKPLMLLLKPVSIFAFVINGIDNEDSLSSEKFSDLKKCFLKVILQFSYLQA